MLFRSLSEDVVRQISARKGEPEFLLEWRLAAYRRWLTMTPPKWAAVQFPPIDFQDIVYYSAPKSKKDGPKSLDEVDPEHEKDQARALVARRLRTMRGLDREVQTRRLAAYLARKGYSSAVSYQVVREALDVLPEHSRD